MICIAFLIQRGSSLLLVDEEGTMPFTGAVGMRIQVTTHAWAGTTSVED